MAQWMDLPKGMQTRGNRQEAILSGGIYTGSDSFDIAENQSVNEYGWDTDENYPALSTARTKAAYGSSGGAVTRFLMNYGNVQLIRAVGAKLQKEVSGTWSDIATALTDTDWDGANFDVNGPVLIMTNSVDPVKYWNGTSVQDLSTNAPKGKYIASDNLRVYISGVPGNESDVIHYCAFQNAQDWLSAENAGSVQFYTANGGSVTALIGFGGQIWAFKKDAFALIYHTGDARATHRLVPSTTGVGCVNYKTLVVLGELLIWLGITNIYIGSSGATSPIGEPVRTFINRINQTYLDKCCAFTDGIRYYLDLVIDSATEPNIRLMYDPRYKIWRVAALNESLRFGTLLNNYAYVGDVNGQTWKMNAAVTSASQAWLIETKDFDSSEAEKEYNELHLQFYAPSGTSLKIEASTDQGTTWYDVSTTLVPSNIAQNQNLIIPLNTMPLGYWGRFRFSGTGPFRLYKFQRYFNLHPVQL